MGIPDGILLKPAQLTDREWAIMHRHPADAFHLPSPIQFPRPALDIPYAHHEHWDGRGYPRGLKSDEIPFAARIFAVVDVWDALCSDRPYRRGWSEEKMHAYSREAAGTQFDPMVVERFLGMLWRSDRFFTRTARIDRRAVSAGPWRGLIRGHSHN
jgi:HD-GYP domain-containing protein (c-di-GMP phosphodiesterase class II)